MEQDNGVQNSVEQVTEQQAREALAPVEAPKAEVKQPTEEMKRVPLAELQKERQRRRIAEEELTRFRQELDEVKTAQAKYNQSKDEDDLIDEAEKSLGIDREQARNLINLQKKAAERVMPKNAPQQMSDPALVAMDRFKQRAAEVSRDYEDWDQMIPSMQAIMARELQENGLGAYSKSPEYYYSKAVKAQKASEAKVKKKKLRLTVTTLLTSLRQSLGVRNARRVPRLTKPSLTQIALTLNGFVKIEQKLTS